MEYNGPANIQMLVEIAKLENNIDPKLASDILQQVDTLTKYMTMLFAQIEDKSKIEPWHVVRESDKWSRK